MRRHRPAPRRQHAVTAGQGSRAHADHQPAGSIADQLAGVQELVARRGPARRGVAHRDSGKVLSQEPTTCRPGHVGVNEREKRGSGK